MFGSRRWGHADGTCKGQKHSRAGVGVHDALVILWGAVQEVTSSRDASKHLLCGLAKGRNGGVTQLPEQETLQHKQSNKFAACFLMPNL